MADKGSFELPTPALSRRERGLMYLYPLIYLYFE
jgi:hypothetical protein